MPRDSLTGMLVLSCLLLLAVLAPAARACDGFKLAVKKVESKCSNGKPSIFQLDGFNLTLDSACVVHPTGCATLKESFKTAELTYIIKSPLGMTLKRDTKDGCALMKKAAEYPQLMMFLNMFSMPTSCDNIEPKKVCGEGKAIDLKPFKDNLRIGSIKGDLLIKHDGDRYSCVMFELTMKK